jgi:hypothetical protein
MCKKLSIDLELAAYLNIISNLCPSFIGTNLAYNKFELEKLANLTFKSLVITSVVAITRPLASPSAMPSALPLASPWPCLNYAFIFEKKIQMYF